MRPVWFWWRSGCVHTCSLKAILEKKIWALWDPNWSAVWFTNILRVFFFPFFIEKLKKEKGYTPKNQWQSLRFSEYFLNLSHCNTEFFLWFYVDWVNIHWISETFTDSCSVQNKKNVCLAVIANFFFETANISIGCGKVRNGCQNLQYLSHQLTRLAASATSYFFLHILKQVKVGLLFFIFFNYFF